MTATIAVWLMELATSSIQRPTCTVETIRKKVSRQDAKAQRTMDFFASWRLGALA